MQYSKSLPSQKPSTRSWQIVLSSLGVKCISIDKYMADYNREMRDWVWAGTASERVQGRFGSHWTHPPSRYSVHCVQNSVFFKTFVQTANIAHLTLEWIDLFVWIRHPPFFTVVRILIHTFKDWPEISRHLGSTAATSPTICTNLLFMVSERALEVIRMARLSLSLFIVTYFGVFVAAMTWVPVAATRGPRSAMSLDW